MEISFLPHTYSDNSKSCTICRDSISEETPILAHSYENRTDKMEDYHIFHTKCLKQWLLTSPTCPTCRSKVKNLNSLIPVSLLKLISIDLIKGFALSSFIMCNLIVAEDVANYFFTQIKANTVEGAANAFMSGAGLTATAVGALCFPVIFFGMKKGTLIMSGTLIGALALNTENNLASLVFADSVRTFNVLGGISGGLFTGIIAGELQRRKVLN